MVSTVGPSVKTLLTDGVQAALLATADGFVIESAAHTPGIIDFDSLAAEAAGIVRAANLIGRDATTAAVRSVVITLDNDQTVVAVPIAGEAVAVVLPRRGLPSELTPATLEQIQATMRHILELHTGKQLLEAMVRVDDALPAASARDRAARVRPGRIALAGVDVQAVGNVATVQVILGLEDRRSQAKTVGRDHPGQRALLAGEATIRAMLELLPEGHAVELTHLQATTPSREALWVLTRFLAPDSEQSLFGIAPVLDGDEATSAAKAILNAVNRRVEILLESLVP